MGAPLRATEVGIAESEPLGLRVPTPIDPIDPTGPIAGPSSRNEPAPAAVVAALPAVGLQVLERLTRGDELDDILQVLTREAESADPRLLASVMLVDERSRRLKIAAAPSLPVEYCQVIDNMAIGPSAGSCGTAAYWGERVIVADIAVDHLWDSTREMALRHGLRACWSEPINASDGRVLGTFAMYCRDVREPRQDELDAMAKAAIFAGIAIERTRTKERMERLGRLYRARSEVSRAIVRSADENELLAEVCRIAVEFAGNRMAWIGAPDPLSGIIEPIAQYGPGLAEVLARIRVSVDPANPGGKGPVGRAYRSGDCCIINDIEAEQDDAPWRRTAQECGVHAVGAFTIRRGNQICAVLTVASATAHCFDPQTVDLLSQVAMDVGFALDNADRARERQEALEALRRSEQHFRAYFESSIVGMAAVDMERNWIEVNEAFCSMLGYTRAEMLGRSWTELTHPDDLAADRAQWEQLRSGAADRFEFDKRHLHKDGSLVHTRIGGRVVREASGTRAGTPAGVADYVVLLVKDTTAPLHAALELDEKSAFIDSILQNEPECVQVLGLDGKLLQMNDAGLKMLGDVALEEVRDTGLLGFILPKHRRPFLRLHADACAGANGVLEFQVRAADGVVRWLEMHATPLRDAAGTVTSVLGITRDISDKKRSAELIWKQANFDLLTGLPNRYMFQDRLAQEIKKARREGGSVALLFIDLDDFKEVNDTLGHENGDALLVAVAQRIMSCVGESDTVARLGGDEFTVILPQASAKSSAEDVAQNIITRLGEGFALGGEPVVLSASIGITVFPADARSVDGLLKNADQAMYVAKRQGRSRVAYFTATMQEEALARLRLISDLRGALAAEQFRVYFQPVLDLKTRRICGAEALLRWEHPTRGMVSPAGFIPLAEETGLIMGIGDWVFREAARWARRWVDRLGADFRVSVNNSPLQFRNAPGILSWLQFLREIELPGRNMTIEITEGLLLDADAGVKDVLRRLREDGLRVAIDDFGTGYSSLAYLHRFQIDALKIDQSFTRNLQTQPSAKALSESIIAMAHKLGLSVVAEGIETAEQLDFLVSAGCDFGQGYLFSRPIPAEAFERLVLDGIPAVAGGA